MGKVLDVVRNSKKRIIHFEKMIGLSAGLTIRDPPSATQVNRDLS